MKNSNYSDWTKEDLVKEMKKMKNRKKYGIVWDEEKIKEEFDIDSKNKLPILKEVKSKEIQTGKDASTNILIEGDNYHSLAVLNFTHTNKIDTIFIDPPYNTGNDTFRYNDDMIERDDPYRHSKWLSFMNKRLTRAKELLKKTGIIFITIDDNEYAQLKLLCDNIFDQNNLIGVICWKSRSSISNDLLISTNHNYILIYSKNFTEAFKNKMKFRFAPILEGFKNRDNDPLGPWKPKPVDGPGGAAKGNPYYEFRGIKGYFRYSKEKMEKLYKNNEIIISGKSIQRKHYLINAKEKGKSPTTWWDSAGTTTEGTNELIQILGEKAFNNPKPTRLIKELLTLTTDNKKEWTVLDFFAGSGTTGHAILDMNKEDGGKRKFILCTNNENEICTEVCHPRVKKAIQGYTNLKKEKVKGLGSNLKYFKIDFVNREPTDKNKKNLAEQCTEILCLKENCFDKIKQTKTYAIFKNHEEKYLGIIYDDDGIDTLKKQIKSINKKFNVYVFSLDSSAREEEFEDVKSTVDLKPIPEIILNGYPRDL